VSPGFGYFLKLLRQLRVAAMARIGGRPRFLIGAVAFFWAVSAAQSGQQIPEIPGLFGIFGGLINTAIVDSARRD